MTRFWLFLFVVVSISIMPGCMEGPTGSAGAQGVQGSVGVTGANCTVQAVAVGTSTPNGGAVITCPNGSSVFVANGADGTTGAAGSDGKDGTNGDTGATGPAGPPGAPGTNGTDATITPVQFCGGAAPAYPSIFPEFGLCIAGNLWGVYSTNGGFLAELPPGAYSSAGVGSACNFTILANCGIQD